jgi:hypothetical protein
MRRALSACVLPPQTKIASKAQRDGHDRLIEVMWTRRIATGVGTQGAESCCLGGFGGDKVSLPSAT